MKVADIMTASVRTISSERSVAFASEKMNEWKIGSLIVVDHGEVQGILTSRDIRSSHPNRIVADAMTPAPVSVKPDDDIWHVHSLLQTHEIERILVMEDGKMKGLVTREEIMRKLSESMDAHTGLYRAPYIRHVGEELLRQERPFHLIFVDINDFGQINKKYGHPFGDDVIRLLSQKLASLMDEKSDYLCRYAGDEFIMLSLAGEERVNHCLQAMTKPLVVDQVEVSVAVGYVNGWEDPHFFACSLRDLIRKASLLSSLHKRCKEEGLANPQENQPVQEGMSLITEWT